MTRKKPTLSQRLADRAARRYARYLRSGRLRDAHLYVQALAWIERIRDWQVYG